MIAQKIEASDRSSQQLGKSADVSVVICVRNGEKIIGDCLDSTAKNQPKEIIVVDGLSTDQTVSIAQSFKQVKIVSDEGKGLAFARRVGVETASGTYILFVGPDNIMEKNFIDDFVRLKQNWGFHAASVQTRVHQPLNFWDHGLDFRWRCLMGTPGPLKVVGTPSLYDRALFHDVKFSEQNMGPNDDTDVADQLVRMGYCLGLVPLLVYEQNGWTASTTWGRFKWYGTGDFYYYRKYRRDWTVGRKFMSITHPLRQTNRYIIKALRALELRPVLWLVFVMAARYYGWMSMFLKSKNK